MRLPNLVVAVAITAFGLLSVGVETAYAGQLDISPVTVTLAGGATSSTVVVTNRGTEPMRLQVSLSAWQQLPNGEMSLAPTQDVLFFPAMLTLNPREARNIRVGTKVSASSVERTYRIFLQELPGLIRNQTERTNAVRMLTKLSVPVFVQPAVPKARPAITGLAVRQGKVAFQVKNGGNAHMRVQKILLRAKDSTRKLHEQSIDGWYVLAGGVRAYEISLPPTVCDAAGTFEVDLESDAGPAQAALNARCVL